MCVSLYKCVVCLSDSDDKQRYVVTAEAVKRVQATNQTKSKSSMNKKITG